jgi:hypothetical protein
MRHFLSFTLFVIPLTLTACAAPLPAGPSVVAMPGQGKTFEAFLQDDAGCRNYASQVTGGASPAQAATNAGIGSAILGTARPTGCFVSLWPCPTRSYRSNWAATR